MILLTYIKKPINQVGKSSQHMFTLLLKELVKTKTKKKTRKN